MGLSVTGMAILQAVKLRSSNTNVRLSPALHQAFVADIMVAINTNAATVVADAAADVVNYQPPPQGAKI